MEPEILRRNIEPNRRAERVPDMSLAVHYQGPQVASPQFIELSNTEAAVLSFETFYGDHYTAIARALSVTLGNAAWGQEAADEAMTRAYDKWSRISEYHNPAGWCYRVGLNWARSWHRKLARRLPWTDDGIELPRTPDVTLDAALADLDLKYRSVVVCRYLLDWSTDETAEALELAPGTVKSRLSTGLDKLHHALAEHPSNPDHKDA